MVNLQTQTIMEATIPSSPHHSLHFVLVPVLAQGHIFPMIDIARLLAARNNITVSFVTTPANLSRISPTVERIQEAKLQINFIPFRFPSVEFGLPAGCENFDSLPSTSLMINFYEACKALKQQLADYLRGPNTPAPNCIIADLGQAWASEIAREFNVPRFVFQGFSCFAQLCIGNLLAHRTHEAVSSDSELFVIPGLEQRIELSKIQLPMQFQDSLKNHPAVKEAREAEMEADGIVVNSFDEMEEGYSELLEKSTKKKVWMIGPVSLSNAGSKDLAERGNKASIDETKCRNWLDSMSPNSVVYVCFGSLGRFTASQMIELGSGLLTSGKPFIWVSKSVQDEELENWLAENIVDESQCLIIRGWAPQVMILSHPSIGGFMTHCGWNSALEGVSAGLPMLTWPMFADQFLNERLLVDVLKIGVSLGVTKPQEWAGGLEDQVAVKQEEIARAVRRLMEGGEEADERRRRAKEYGERATSAMKEGGSSYLNLTELICYVSAYQRGQNVR